MANTLYPKFKEALLRGDPSANLETKLVKGCILDSSYVFSGTHEFKSDLLGILSNSNNEIQNKTFDNGLFDGDSLVFRQVTEGAEVTSLVLYTEGDSDGSSRLVMFFDTVNEFPLSTIGGDISANWNTQGIFVL